MLACVDRTRRCPSGGRGVQNPAGRVAADGQNGPPFLVSGLAIAYTMTAFETGAWMVWVHRPQPTERPDSTWTWRLDVTADGRTRLVTRMKQD